MTEWEAITLLMLVAGGAAYGLWLVRPQPRAPYPAPPNAAEDYEAYLEWQAKNPNLPLVIRAGAAKVLAKRASERACQERLRTIVRDEVRRALGGNQ